MGVGVFILFILQMGEIGERGSVGVRSFRRVWQDQ